MKKDRVVPVVCGMLMLAASLSAADSKSAAKTVKTADKSAAADSSASAPAQDTAAAVSGVSAPAGDGSTAALPKKAEKQPEPGAAVKCESGKVRFVLRGSLGTCELYAVDRDGTAVPVFAGYDSFSSTYFLVKAGKTEYKLAAAGGITAAAVKTAGGGKITYSVPRTADVSAELSFMKTQPGSDDDMLKVQLSVTNRRTRTDSFALKGVFDTVLGEKTDTHFSTAQTKSVNSEVQFRTMKNEKWITSRGDGTAVQFLFDGPGITPPSLVTLGNKDIVSLPLWEPVAASTRSFDNVMSYNNSAVAVNWDKTELKPGQTASVVFYIVLASGGDEPAGGAYLTSLSGDGTGKAGTEQSPSAVQTPVPAALPPLTVPKQKTDVPFDVITEEKLDPEYIRALISRINSLEDDGSTVNRDELLRLNTELDAILAKLRQQ
jgi:hypothetical protein